MAFVSIIFGSILGLISAVTGSALFDLGFWQSLFVYSASGVLFTSIAIATLLFLSRSQTSLSTSGNRVSAL